MFLCGKVPKVPPLLPLQLGTLGAGNHYAEIQVVDEIYNKFNARKMGIEETGQICVMIHCGSRGLGHQVATGWYCGHSIKNLHCESHCMHSQVSAVTRTTKYKPWSFSHDIPCHAFIFSDALVAMEKAMKRDKIEVNDRQLACAEIQSPEGQEYLKGMAAAANYAWVNRSSMTFLCRQVSRLHHQ